MKSRTAQFIKNSIYGLLSTVIIVFLSFVVRKIFIVNLPIELLGLNALITNIIAMLALAELGIGTAIIYSLYQPMAQNNFKEIKGLLNFYKKAYYIISGIMFVVGLSVIPFLPFFVDSESVNVNVYIVYFLFVIGNSVSFLFKYKKSILLADQRKYIITNVLTILRIVFGIMQIIILIYTANFYYYVIAILMPPILEGVICNIIVNRDYNFLKNDKIKPHIPSSKISALKENIKSLFIYKLGALLFEATDNILIASINGLGVLGVYSNYFLITNTVRMFITQVTSSLIAGFGNLINKKDIEYVYKTFLRTSFLVYGIYMLACSCLYVLIQPFITLWLGEEYLLSNISIVFIILTLFLNGIIEASLTIQHSAGTYKYDKYAPLLQAGIKICLSLTLGYKYGIEGILFANLLSILLIPLLVKPYIIHKYVFKKPVLNYYKRNLGYSLVFILNIIICHVTVITMFERSVTLLKIMAGGVITVIITLTIMTVFYYKRSEYKFIVNSIKKQFLSILKK